MLIARAGLTPGTASLIDSVDLRDLERRSHLTIRTFPHEFGGQCPQIHLIAIAEAPASSNARQAAMWPMFEGSAGSAQRADEDAQRSEEEEIRKSVVVAQRKNRFSCGIAPSPGTAKLL